MAMTEEEHKEFLRKKIARNAGIHPPGGYRLVKGEHRFIVDYSDSDDRHADYLGVETWVNVPEPQDLLTSSAKNARG